MHGVQVNEADLLALGFDTSGDLTRTRFLSAFLRAIGFTLRFITHPNASIWDIKFADAGHTHHRQLNFAAEKQHNGNLVALLNGYGATQDLIRASLRFSLRSSPKGSRKIMRTSLMFVRNPRDALLQCRSQSNCFCLSKTNPAE